MDYGHSTGNVSSYHGCYLCADETIEGNIFNTFREIGDNQKLQGLGLVICQSIAKLLGGKLWLDEGYTDGSRFIFELPEKNEKANLTS